MTSTPEQQPMGIQKRHAALLLLFFILAYLFPLGVRALCVPDETRYAEIPREMIVSGDWTVPHLNGLRYFEKPPLGYWAHAGSILVFGETNFAVRLPSALAVGLSALLIMILMMQAHRGDDPKNNFSIILAPLVLLSCFEVFGVGNTAVLDNLFALFLTATITAFYLATEAGKGSFREKIFLILSGICCSLAFLTKGFLAAAVPALTLAPYLVWQRRFPDLFRMSWIPILTTVLVALPWGVMIHLKEADFWHFFFWNEHIRRFIASNAQHDQSFWFFFLAAPGMIIPWAFVVPAAIPGIKKVFNDPGHKGRIIRLSICWLVFPFLFFSISKGKLLTYILPCFPPFAILMAFGLVNGLTMKKSTAVFNWGVRLIMILFILILIAFIPVQVFGIHGMRPYAQPWKAVMAVNGIFFFILFCFWALKSHEVKEKLILFGLAPLLFFFIVHYIIPDPVIASKSPGPLLERNRQSISAEDIIISDEATIHAVCWYLKRSNIFVLEDPNELDYGFSYPDAQSRHLDFQSAASLIRSNPGRIVLIARGKTASRWQDQLPEPLLQDNSGPKGYVIWRY